LIMLLPGSISLGVESPLVRSDKIPDAFVSFGRVKGTEYAIVVETETQRLFLFAYNGTFREVSRMNCSTGEMPGSKSRSGDEKTPEGVYFFTREYTDKELSPIYGTRAFPIDYPNALDRHLGLDGNSIWLHGTNKVLKPRDTNGCIALGNQNIDYLKKFIRLNKTPFIITEKISYVPAGTWNKEKKSILELLSQWSEAVDRGTYHDYLRFYDPGYLPDISWWMQWNKLRKTHKGQPFSVKPNDVSIFQHKGVYVTLFDLSLSFSGKSVSAGTKKFFLSADRGQLRIIAEEYLGMTENKKVKEKPHPLILAYNSLRSSPVDASASAAAEDRKIAALIDGWLSAWSSKDIKRYASYYAEDFRSQKGMNLKRWIEYKDRLNRKYDYIQVSINKLKIKTDGNKSTASFRQTYKTNSFRSTCYKRLIFKSVNGSWKIFREFAR